MNKVFLLDAYALIFRAYYAFINRPIVNSKGLNTSAIYGFVNVLEDVLRNQNPTHIAVVFDPSGPTFRHKMYEPYKANRDETPEDIRISVPYIKQIIEAFQIPCIHVDNYEADDVIGTLAKKFVDAETEIYMMTPDKDYAQLLEEKIVMYKPGRGGNPAEVFGIPEMREKYGIQHASQIIDMLALMGDSADNIPGVGGVGEKTAIKLIQQFESVDNLLENVDQVKGKLKDKIINDKDQLILSKTLVTIDLNVPVSANIEELKVQEKNKEELGKLFDELEFRTIKKRILGDEKPEPEVKTQVLPADDGMQGSLFDTTEVRATTEYKTIKDFEKDYRLVQTQEDLDKFVEIAEKAEVLCFDTETTGIDVFDSELVGVAFTFKTHSGFFIPVHTNTELNDLKNEVFNKVLGNQGTLKIAHNCKFDIQILKQFGVEVQGPFFDTMIAHYLLEPDRKHKMDILAEDYLQYKPIAIETLIGKKGKKQGSMKDADLVALKDYATEDTDVTWQLYEIFQEQIQENQMHDLLLKVELPLMEVLSHIELDGVKLDSDHLNEYAKTLTKDLIALEESIYKHAGEHFNINSPKQLGDIIFGKLKIDAGGKKTKTKQFSTSEETLLKIADKHPIINEILEFRGVKKLLSTYVEALPKLVKEKTGKIHTSFNQTIAATGRLSSTNPNLQNIPIRDERGKELRKAFIPSDEERTILAADYSQIELRLMAHLSGDKQMVEAFNQEADIHTATASKIYKIDPEEVTRDMRSKAKTANFGIIYGISAFGLAQRLNIPRSEAKELIDGYFQSFPDVRVFMDEQVKLAREKQYVETVLGRRRYLADINSRNAVVRGYAERNAINAPIQGSAADIIKIAMIRIFEKMNGKFKSSMVLQVHDELVFDAYKSELEELKPLIKTEMENAYQISVPLTVDMNDGINWLEAH